MCLDPAPPVPDDETAAQRRDASSGTVQSTSRDLVLHRATCYHWKGNRRWLASYSKTCADSIGELQDWAATSTGSSELQRGAHCAPH
jgi:hypothetical protein